MLNFLLELIFNYDMTILLSFICGSVAGCAGMVLLDEWRKRKAIRIVAHQIAELDDEPLALWVLGITEKLEAL